MHKYESCPDSLAAAVLTDTAEFEATHPELKGFGRFSNQRPDEAAHQVGKL